jgi:2-polyprenyl-3-methyl-5-hydroxy-6-metoxy-1,4-benzoquinol methylase
MQSDSLNAVPANHEVVQVWEQNADFWDKKMGEGNDFHKLLIEPTQLKLLNLRGGEMVLDVACGNGQFARQMAELGAQVVAVDASDGMIQAARSRSTGYEGRIEYRVLDCTNKDQLLSVGERQFDRVVCTMALMDIIDIQPLAWAAARLLKSEGRFVFSLCHPCFNSGLTKHGVERHDIGGELVEEYFVRVSRYSDSMTTKGLAMVGQPVPQYYFHRPLSMLLGHFFNEGFVLDGLEEPAFGDNAQASRLFDMVYQRIPPALVVRLRLAATGMTDCETD